MAMSLSVEILLCVGYAVIFITNIVGNLLVCAIVFKTKKLRNFTSILIVNMAVGDLIVGVVGVMHIILEVWFLVGGINKYSLLWGRLNAIVRFSASHSIYNMAVLAYDRYLSIVKPMERHTKNYKKQTENHHFQSFGPRLSRSSDLVCFSLKSTTLKMKN